MVWYDMVWYGMVWYGMVWYGLVWQSPSLAVVANFPGFFTRVSPTQCKRIVTKTPHEYMPYIIFTSMVHTSNIQVHTSNVRVRVRQSESAFNLHPFATSNVFCDPKSGLRLQMCFAIPNVFCDFQCVL